IMVSIDGVTKEVFEAIRLRLSFETVLANTLELIRIRNQRQVPLSVRIRMVIMKENEHEVRPFFEFWNARVATQDRVYAKHAHTWGNQMGVEKESLVARFRDRPCVSPFSSMIIQVDGRVPLCGVDYNVKLPMGDFSKQTIRQIWQGEGLTRVRDLHAS